MKNGGRRGVVCALGLAFVLLGAATFSQKKPPGKKQSAGDYWPMQPGNAWTLAVKANGQSVPTQRVLVTGVQSGSDGRTVRLVYQANNKTVQSETYLVKPDTVYRLTSNAGAQSRLEPPFPVIRLPMRDGQQWKWEGVIRTGQNRAKARSTLTVSGPALVKTPAGTFGAYKVQSELIVESGGREERLPNAYWFAPGIGLIQQYIRVGEAEVQSLLSSYTHSSASAAPNPGGAPPKSNPSQGKTQRSRRE
jgi:hypothetical protein